MNHIVSFSGGKDSTAMLLTMLANGMKVDEVVFIDTTAEFPQMYKHIESVKSILNFHDIKFTTLKFEHDFEYYMLEYEKKKGKNKGSKGYGWCGGLCRWGTQYKKNIFSKYIREKYNNEIIEYQGIAHDEPERIAIGNNKKWEIRYPLNEWNIVESEALKFCYDMGFDWGGLYEILDRVSCKCCRNKNLKELKNIYFKMPETWSYLKWLEREIGDNMKNKSLDELEQRFKREGLQLNLKGDKQ